MRRPEISHRTALGPVVGAVLGALALSGCGGASHAVTVTTRVASSAPAPGDPGAHSATATTGSGASAASASADAGKPAAARSGATGTAAAAGSNRGAPSGSGGVRRSSAGHAPASHSEPAPYPGNPVPPHPHGPPLHLAANVPDGGQPSSATGLPFEIHTTSMSPTYQQEATVYYDPSRTHPQVGEVVIFDLPVGGLHSECGAAETEGAPCMDPIPGLTQTLAIKRVVAVGGDTLAIEHGEVILNGQPEQEPPTIPCQSEGGCEFPKTVTIPQGYYFVMSDNRELFEEDSRVFGPIPQAAIVGTVEESGTS
jgi:signal peptidase I